MVPSGEKTSEHSGTKGQFQDQNVDGATKINFSKAVLVVRTTCGNWRVFVEARVELSRMVTMMMMIMPLCSLVSTLRDSSHVKSKAAIAENSTTCKCSELKQTLEVEAPLAYNAHRIWRMQTAHVIEMMNFSQQNIK